MNTAEFLIKKEIIKMANNWNQEIAIPNDCDVIQFYDDNKYDVCEIIDATYEFRDSGIETNLEAPYSRHYESEQVAAKIADQWVSWTFWHGGGKHGEPEAIDWIESAKIVNCTEEEVMTIKRTFSE